MLGEGRKIKFARVFRLDEDPIVHERGDFNLDMSLHEVDLRHHALRFEVLKPIGERDVLPRFTGMFPTALTCIVVLGKTGVLGKPLLDIAYLALEIGAKPRDI